jgi:O-antigen ligase/cytochrome c-type biogenesis protein CcmH/NrfG
MLKKDIYNNTILYLLNFLIIVTPFLVYRYVDYYRANQKLWVQAISIIVLFLVLLKIINGFRINISKDRLSLLFIVFFIYISTSLLYSSSRLLTSRTLLLFFCYIFLYLVIVNLKIKNKIDIIANTFIIAAFLIALYIIFHYYGLITYLAMYGQIFSPIGQKNITSNFLSLAFPLALVFSLLEKERIKKNLYFIVVIIIYTAIIICQSRGIWISILLTIPIAILLIKKSDFQRIFKDNKKNLIVLLFFMILITAVYSTDNPLNRSRLTVPQRAFSVFDKEDTSINMRLIMLNSSLKMISERPLFGFGLGTFNINYPEYQGKYLQENPGMVKYLSDGNVVEAHNEYVQLATEVGIIGLMIFLFIILYFYWNTWLFQRSTNIDEKNKMVNLGLFLGINIYLVHCLFTFPFHVAYPGVSFFMVMGLANFIQIRNKGSNSNLNFQLHLRKSIKIFSMISLCLIFVLTTYLFIIKPYLSEIYSFQGQKAYYIDEDLSKSIDYFEQAVETDPYNGRILLHLGATYLNANIVDGALDTLERSKKYYMDKNIYRNIANYHRKNGNNEKAAEILKKVLFLYPQYIKAYNELASLYIYDGEYKKAITQWKKAIELNRDFKEKHIFLYYIGMAYQRMGNQEEAYNYFLKALKEAPDDSPIREDIEQELLKIFQK